MAEALSDQRAHQGWYFSPPYAYRRRGGEAVTDRKPPPFKPDQLTPEQHEFLAWVNAVNERGEPRYGPTEMPWRGLSMPHDLLYDIIRSARLAHMLISTIEDVNDAKRRDAEARLAEAANPVEAAHRIIQAFENMRPGAKMEVLRNTRGFQIQGIGKGATITEALDDYLRDPRSRRAMK